MKKPSLWSFLSRVGSLCFLVVLGSQAGTVTVTGSGLTQQGGSSVCNYTQLSEDGSGNWTITCGTSSSSITISPAVYGTVCSSYSTITESSLGAWTVNGCVSAVTPPPIQYVYDPNGRLVAVIDQTGGTAKYVYDPTGNITSIVRGTGAVTDLFGFAPTAGPIGTAVTISGTGFSSTPSQNTVTFNGIGAAVTAATANSLSVTVPVGATTGSVAVTSPAGSMTSSYPFVVTSIAPAPQITSFTPTSGAWGTSVTISGSNFGVNAGDNIVSFGGLDAQIQSFSSSSIAATVPTNATTGHITVQTRDGSATSSGTFVVPPAGFGVSDVLATYSLIADGASVAANINVAGKVVELTFDATTAQSLGLGVTGVTYTPSNGLGHVVIYAPDGAVVASIDPLPAAGSAVQLNNLPLTGTYTIAFSADPSNTASATFTLSNPFVASITVDAAATTYTAPRNGQAIAVAFTATPGQWLTLAESGAIPGTLETVRVLDPFGQQIAPTSVMSGATTYQLPIPQITISGTHSIVVAPYGIPYATPPVQITLALLADTVSSITFGAPATSVTFTNPNRSVVYTSNAYAGALLGTKISSSTLSGQVRIYYTLNSEGYTTFSTGSPGAQFNASLYPPSGQPEAFATRITPNNATGSLALAVGTPIATFSNMTGPASLVRGYGYTVSGTLTNTGNVDLFGDVISFALSTTPSLAGAVPGGGAFQHPPLLSGGAYTFSANASPIPIGTTPGTYYLVFVVAPNPGNYIFPGTPYVLGPYTIN